MGNKLDAVIVGVGRSGLGLHVPILEKLNQLDLGTSAYGSVVGIVEPVQQQATRALNRLADDFERYEGNEVEYRKRIAQLSVARESTVVHICTPANDHLSSFLAAVDAGFRKILIEKPCATRVEEVDEMIEVAREESVQVQVVNPYLHSRCIRKCKEKIENTRSRLRYIEFELSKPRKRPTLKQRSSPESVFDVELPHQVATALFLTESKRPMVLRTDKRDMHYREEGKACKVVADMGLGVVVLELGDCLAVLASYLDSTTRTRALRLRFRDKREIHALLPVTEESNEAQVDIYGPRGDHREIDKIDDDLFGYCLFEVYRLFSLSGAGYSDLLFNRRVVSVLERAKRQVGVLRE